MSSGPTKKMIRMMTTVMAKVVSLRRVAEVMSLRRVAASLLRHAPS